MSSVSTFRAGYPRLLPAILVLCCLTAVARATVPVAPSNLGGAVINTTTLYLSVDDNSTNETGFDVMLVKSGVTSHVQITSGSASTTATTAGTGNVILGLVVTAGSTYTVQVASYITNTNAGNISAYTPAITVTTTSGLTTAPAIVSATATSETALRFVLVDNSASEAGTNIEASVSGGAFALAVGIGAANYSNVNVSGWQPGTTYQFRDYEFSGTSASPGTQTPYSNTVTVTTPFYAPTGLTATAANESTVNLAWTDNSAAEGGYSIYYALHGSGSYTLLTYAAANATSYSVTGLSPGTAYDFQVAAAYQSTTVIESARSNTATATTKDGFTSSTSPPLFYNQTFSYQAVVSTGSARSSWNITSLPAGLTFTSSTGVVSGTPTVSGVFSCPMTATFANGWTTNATLTLRIIRAPAAPVITSTITGPTLTAGGNTSITLGDKFSDPDSESAVRIVTNVGTMDFILYNTATPQTVANFLSYVNAAVNNYNGAVFHRAVPGFVVQGGAFKVLAAPNNFSVTPTSASPVNEPGISNLRGTVAMAKLGTDPNSATDQFFVNVADNSANLDNQNGGFTVFARVAAGNGMGAADAIANLPSATYTVNLGGTSTSMDSWPLTSSSTLMDTTKVVSITSAATIPVLSYSVTGNTNSAVATASITGGTSVQVNALSGGQSSITVAATDLDGNVTPQTFTVTVNQAPAFTSAAPTGTGLVGTAYNFTCTASGYPAPTFSVTAGALPGGLSLGTGGAITGTPTTAGTFTGTITASNGSGTVPQNFSITINQVPAFTNGPPPASGVNGTAYSFSYTASGSPVPTFAVTAGGLPTGLTLSSGGAITGTPTATGLFTGTVTATNAVGTATQDFSISINQAPAFTNGPPPTTGLKNFAAYSFTCTASGFPAPTFSVTAGALPGGLGLNSAGLISGTPNTNGTFTGTITATNAAGTATQNFSITINELPTITNGPPPGSGTTGTAYAFTYTATGSPAPTFSISSGALPAGLTLSSAGVISGTPTAGGVFTGNVTAGNSVGNFTQGFTITINQAPAFTSAAPTSPASKGATYSFNVTAAGYPAPTFAVTAGVLPTGLTLTTGGLLSGTPTVAGVFTGTITATNSVSTATQNFSITVNATLSDWAAGKGLTGADALPGADPDHDGRTNLQEFAFMTEPTVPDAGTVPTYALATAGASKYGEITFPVRKYAPSLTYSVEVSDTLTSGTWTTLWTSTDGFGTAAVVSAADQTDRTVVTITDNQASPPATRRFLRVTVTGQ